jgi:hypothetical protein
MNISIYKIEREYLEIAEVLKDNGGELTEDLELALAINQQDLTVKAGQYGLIIKDTEHELKTDNLKINFRKSTSVEIEDETLIPELYFETVVTKKIIKKDIGDILKAGLEVPGAILKNNKNLQIK